MNKPRRTKRAIGRRRKGDSSGVIKLGKSIKLIGFAQPVLDYNTFLYLLFPELAGGTHQVNPRYPLPAGSRVVVHNKLRIHSRLMAVTAGMARAFDKENDVIPAAFVERLRLGADRTDIDEVASLADLTKQEIGHLLGVSEGYLYNRSPKFLTTIQTELLEALKGLFSYGSEFFEGDIGTFSEWLRTPLAALAIPQTGFPSPISADFVPPTIEELFAGSTEEEEQEAIQANLVYMLQQQSQPGPEYPTPLSLLDTFFGVQHVRQILGRVDAGVFS